MVRSFKGNQTYLLQFSGHRIIKRKLVVQNNHGKGFQSQRSLLPYDQTRLTVAFIPWTCPKIDLFGAASTGYVPWNNHIIMLQWTPKSKQNSTLAARMIYRQQDKQAREFLSPGKQIRSISPVYEEYLGRQQMKALQLQITLSHLASEFSFFFLKPKYYSCVISCRPKFTSS